MCIPIRSTGVQCLRQRPQSCACRNRCVGRDAGRKWDGACSAYYSVRQEQSRKDVVDVRIFRAGLNVAAWVWDRPFSAAELIAQADSLAEPFPSGCCNLDLFRSAGKLEIEEIPRDLLLMLVGCRH